MQEPSRNWFVAMKITFCRGVCSRIHSFKAKCHVDPKKWHLAIMKQNETRLNCEFCRFSLMNSYLYISR